MAVPRPDAGDKLIERVLAALEPEHNASVASQFKGEPVALGEPVGRQFLAQFEARQFAVMAERQQGDGERHGGDQQFGAIGQHAEKQCPAQ